MPDVFAVRGDLLLIGWPCLVSLGAAVNNTDVIQKENNRTATATAIATTK